MFGMRLGFERIKVCPKKWGTLGHIYNIIFWDFKICAPVGHKWGTRTVSLQF